MQPNLDLGLPALEEKIEIAPIRFGNLTEEAVDNVMNTYVVEREKVLRGARKKWAKQNFTPFDLGFDCNAYHMFSFLLWEVRPEPSSDLLEIFDEGNLHEVSIKKKIESAGLRIANINEPFTIKWNDCFPIRGKMDMILEAEGGKLPTEAKSMSPHIFSSIDTWEDMLHHNSIHVRNYPYQLMLYQHAFGKANWGMFVLKNKVTGVVKFVKQPYRADMIETIKQRVLIVTKAVRDQIGDLDQMRNFDEKRCGHCDFRFNCLGENANKLVQVITNEELENLLLRREELKPLNSEYDLIDKTVKKQFKGTEEAVIGDFYIKGKEIHRDAYSVEPGSYWKASILYKGKK